MTNFLSTEIKREVKSNFGLLLLYINNYQTILSTDRLPAPLRIQKTTIGKMYSSINEIDREMCAKIAVGLSTIAIMC